MRWLPVLCLAAGCGVRLEGGSSATPDGSTTLTPDGSTTNPDAAVACPNGRRVYLNFEGQTLIDGASDATTNRASWMTITQGTAPRYRTGAADRDAQIQAIVSGVRQQLSSFPIEVVTTRPATGPYVMIVYGGVASQVGSNYGGAVNELDCGDLRKSDVAWMGDGVSPPQRVINFTIGAIGFGLGLTATTDTLGCMCQWDNGCVQQTTLPCRLSPMINRDPNANQRCQGLITQNEVAAFSTGFCQ